MDNQIFETYKISAMLHVQHINQSEYDATMATMCTYPPSQHKLPHRKCVFRYYA